MPAQLGRGVTEVIGIETCSLTAALVRNVDSTS